jgi:hypothetical protein
VRAGRILGGRYRLDKSWAAPGLIGTKTRACVIKRLRADPPAAAKLRGAGRDPRIDHPALRRWSEYLVEERSGARAPTRPRFHPGESLRPRGRPTISSAALGPLRRLVPASALRFEPRWSTVSRPRTSSWLLTAPTRGLIIAAGEDQRAGGASVRPLLFAAPEVAIGGRSGVGHSLGLAVICDDRRINGPRGERGRACRPSRSATPSPLSRTHGAASSGVIPTRALSQPTWRGSLRAASPAVPCNSRRRRPRPSLKRGPRDAAWRRRRSRRSRWLRFWRRVACFGTAA